MQLSAARGELRLINPEDTATSKRSVASTSACAVGVLLSQENAAANGPVGIGLGEAVRHDRIHL